MKTVKTMMKFSMLPLELSEKVLTEIYKEKVFLKLVTLGLDQQLRWQEKAQKRTSKFLKYFNIPDRDEFESLAKNVIELEKELEKYKMQVAEAKKTKKPTASRRPKISQARTATH